MTKVPPTTSRTGKPDSVAPIVLLNLLGSPFLALASSSAAHFILEDGGYPDARYGQDATNLLICIFFFVLITVVFLLADAFVLLKLKQLKNLKSWCTGVGILVLPAIALFVFLVLTGTNLG